jgi:hypothetical protein
MIDEDGHTTDDWVKAIFLGRLPVKSNSFKIAKPLTIVSLWVVSVKDLGFDFEVEDFSLIVKKAKKIGLKLCSLEVAAQLCLKYKGRKNVTIASKPAIKRVDDSQLFLQIWNSNKKGCKIFSTKYDPEGKVKWSLDENLVFMKNE